MKVNLKIQAIILLLLVINALCIFPVAAAASKPAAQHLQTRITGGLVTTKPLHVGGEKDPATGVVISEYLVFTKPTTGDLLLDVISQYQPYLLEYPGSNVIGVWPGSWALNYGGDNADYPIAYSEKTLPGSAPTKSLSPISSLKYRLKMRDFSTVPVASQNGVVLWVNLDYIAALVKGKDIWTIELRDPEGNTIEKIWDYGAGYGRVWKDRAIAAGTTVASLVAAYYTGSAIVQHARPAIVQHAGSAIVQHAGPTPKPTIPVVVEEYKPEPEEQTKEQIETSLSYAGLRTDYLNPVAEELAHYKFFG